MADNENEAAQSAPKVAAWVERMLAKLATLCFNHAPLAGVITVLVTALFAYKAQGLGLNTDVSQLLPDSFESVRDVKRLSEEFGGAGYVVVIAEGKDRETLVRFAEAAAPKLGELESVAHVDYKRPVAFFEDRALYFLDQNDLSTVRDRIERRRDWEVSKAQGALLDESEPAPPIDLSDLQKKYEDKLQLTNGSGANEDAKDRDPEYYLSKDGTKIALLVKPSKLSSDLNFCKQVVADVERTLAALPEHGTTVNVELSGRYKKRVDIQEVLGDDLAKASLAAFVLILGYVTWHFRRISAVLLVFVPLITALTATYGFAALTIGSLNILTSFIGAILLGLGVDNGIHLLNRYYEERGAGREPVVAIQKAFGEAARASSAAMLTNVGAFLCLLIAEFKAFREFGVLAAGGMFFTLFSYVIIVPILLGIGERLFRSKPIDDAPPFTYAKPLVRWAPAAFYGLSVLFIFALLKLPEVRFNYDFKVVDEADLPSFKLEKTVRELLGRSETTLVVFGDTAEEAEQIAGEIRKRKAERGQESSIGRILTLPDLVPHQQADKAPIIEEIGELVERLRDEHLSAEQRDQRQRILRMTAEKPFTKDDLPLDVRRQFTKQGQSELANFVLLSPTVSLSDGLAVQRLAGEVSDIVLPSGKHVRAAGEPLVLADILTSMQRELPWVLGLALLQQIVLLWILMGSLERGLLTIFPALVTVPLMAAVLPEFGLSFNYLNVILLPTLLGMGEDGGAHLVARVSAGDKLDDALGYTARGTLGAGVTSAVGFGAMTLASHPGLRSFGYVSVIGLTLNLLVCLVFLPTFIAVLQLWRDWRADGRGGLSSVLATVGYAGATPRGGGTVGALVALPVAWLMRSAALPVRVGAALAVGAGSIWVTTRYLQLRPGFVAHARSKPGDPQEVVLDEFAGALLAMSMVAPSPWALALAFVLFRVFDIVKPWPVRWAERKLGGGVGVVGDDLVAGLMAGAAVMLLQLALG